MNIGKLIISWDRGGVSEEELRGVHDAYEQSLRNGKRLVLCVLAARSGTRWLSDIFEAHKNATGITERYFEAESMYRFISYNDLPIDTAGIITLIKYGILQDWKRGDISFVTSPFFSHGIEQLNRELRPERIVFGCGEPRFSTQSIYNKGFFSHYYIHNDPSLALGFQPSFPQRWYWLYLFARLVPKGKEAYRQWEQLTRIGKIAWWGTMVNRDIWKQLQQLPKEKIYLFNLKDADQNYEYYLKLAEEFGLAPVLSKRTFLAIKKQTVLPSHNISHTWSEQEQREFEDYSRDWYALYYELFPHMKPVA